MQYDYEDYGIRIIKDIPVGCSNCGNDFFIDTEEIDCVESYDKGSMGTRTSYKFLAISSCPRCGQEISFEQEASEYPPGAIEYVFDSKCYGGELLLLPEVDIPYYDDELYVSVDSIYTGRLDAEPEILEIRQKLNVNIIDGNADIRDQLYLPNKRTTIWLNPAKRLLPILIDETGSIRFENNQAVFAEMIQDNPRIGAMRLLGKVAEAVIVRNCMDNAELNRAWLSKARKNRTIQRIADSFRAIGTGLYSTKKYYPQKYSPTNPQRDIIWINERGDYALVSKGQLTSGMIAGLQVKVSGNGLNYIRKDLVSCRYEVPLIYFPINNDYDMILENVNKNGLIVEPGVDFINVLEVDDDAFYEICDYYPLLVNLFAGRISGDEFVRYASGIIPLRNGILASSLSLPKTDVRIIH